MNATVTTLSNGSLIELNDREVEEVSGGGFLVIVAGIAAAAAAWAAVEQVGEKLGKAVYYATH